MSETHYDKETITALIAQLGHRDVLERERAVHDLAKIGNPAVEPLMKALKDPNARIRGEAARALGHICDPEAAPALVEALEDARLDVRWIVGESLICLGYDGMVALLDGLINEKWDAMGLREGAHHIIRKEMSAPWSKHLSPVLSALEEQDPEVSVPKAAHEALGAIKDMRAKGLI